MPLDVGALQRGCGDANTVSGRQFCRAELERFRVLAASATPVTIGCTQEAPLFGEVAAATNSDVSFANLRETAGWSTQASQAGAKMAALAAQPMPNVPYVQLESAGVLLLYGRDQQAIEAANLLKEHLDITVLVTRPENLMPPRVTDIPIVKGTIRNAKGCLGAFEIVIDDYAASLPSSRNALAFGSGRDGAVSHCDILLDISGGAPLFPAADLREGYVRAESRRCCRPA